MSASCARLYRRSKRSSEESSGGKRISKPRKGIRHRRDLTLAALEHLFSLEAEHRHSHELSRFSFITFDSPGMRMSTPLGISTQTNNHHVPWHHSYDILLVVGEASSPADSRTTCELSDRADYNQNAFSASNHRQDVFPTCHKRHRSSSFQPRRLPLGLAGRNSAVRLARSGQWGG